MTKLDHTYVTMGKFLSIASASKVLREFYGEEIPKERMLAIVKELEDISNDYLYPKYILKGSSLVDINDQFNIEYKNNPIPQEIWDDNEVESVRTTYLMPEVTITEYRTESDNMFPLRDCHNDGDYECMEDNDGY